MDISAGFKGVVLGRFHKVIRGKSDTLLKIPDVGKVSSREGSQLWSSGALCLLV